MSKTTETSVLVAGLRLFPYHSNYSAGLPTPWLLFHTLHFKLFYICLQDKLQTL